VIEVRSIARDRWLEKRSMSQPRNLNLWAVAWSCTLGLAATGCSLSRQSGDEAVNDPATADTLAAPMTAAIDATQDSGERVDHLLAAAKAAEAQGELRAADEAYARVLELDPNNPDAQSGRARVQQVGGIAPPPPAEPPPAGSPAQAVADDAAELEMARRDQVRVEAESRVRQGEVAFEAGDFDKAIRNFEDALLIVQYRPYLVGGDLTESSLQSRIESARAARNEQKRQAEIERQSRVTRENEQKESDERARIENTIRRLFEAANAAYVDDRFSETESYLADVLKLDPTNAAAHELRDLARDARMQSKDRTTREAYKREWRKSFDDMTENLRPEMDLVGHPSESEWRKIRDRGPVEFTVQDDLISPAERAILDRLKTSTITLGFDGATLTQAVDWFRANTGVNFVISAGIRAAGDEPVFSVNVGSLPALEALDLLLSLSTTPLVRRIENGVVAIKTTEEDKGGQILEIYDVRDLTKVINQFPGKDFNLTPSGFTAEDSTDAGAEPQPLALDSEKLVELIKTNIAKESWDADPANTIQPVTGALVVRQVSEVHDQIRTLLNDLRQSAGTLINIETRFVTVNDQFLEDIGVDLRGLGPADEANPDATFPAGLVVDDFGSIPDGVGTVNNPVGIGTDNDLGVFYTDDDFNGDVRARVENLYDTTIGSKVFGEGKFDNTGGIAVEWEGLGMEGGFLDDTLAEAVLRAVSKYGTRNIVNAPSLTVYNGQQASINVTNFISFVKDFDVEIAAAAAIADPIIEVIAEGVVLDVKPVVSSDRRFVTMQLKPTVTTLRRPMATFTTSLGIGTAVTIEIPELTIERARTTVTMPDGATLILGGWKLTEDQDFNSGIPYLNKIPVINFLFTRKGKFLNKQKLVILVRAKIVIPEEYEPDLAPVASGIR
jgi:Flp pilus assembly secretin CpaC/tetratricopeptide (TPR) repeat protein